MLYHGCGSSFILCAAGRQNINKDGKQDSMTDLPVRFEERMRALLGEEYPAFAASYDKERVQGGLTVSSSRMEGETQPEAGKTKGPGKIPAPQKQRNGSDRKQDLPLSGFRG